MTHTKFIDTARRVIRAEADALGQLADALGQPFADAVDLILGAHGRIIISGIGKSGHIARKIAATLASTGTPAHFVHPAEASHGDLGMVTKGDVVLAISNSGEAPELANLIAYTQRFAIPLVAITSRAESSLATQSDIVLLIPKLPEACGTGVVPTTSTTMTLALGDALCVAIMEHRAFSADNTDVAKHWLDLPDCAVRLYKHCLVRVTHSNPHTPAGLGHPPRNIAAHKTGPAVNGD